MKVGTQNDSAKLRYQLYRLFWVTVDWLYPPDCGGCGQKGSRWCGTCQSQTIPLTSAICPRCGNPLNSSSHCSLCQKVTPSFDLLRSCTAFQGPIRMGMHRLKYRKDLGLGEVYSRYLIDLYSRLQWQVDLVMPVPLSEQRLAERGYNQAAILAKPFALALGIDYSTGYLKRRKETRSQVGLTYQQRRENVQGAFWADPKVLAGKAVLVIDDVTTTGATIESCAHAAKEAGASSVYGLTLARAVLGRDQIDPISLQI